jgi:hypothetical protein
MKKYAIGQRAKNLHQEFDIKQEDFEWLENKSEERDFKSLQTVFGKKHLLPLRLIWQLSKRNQSIKIE